MEVLTYFRQGWKKTMDFRICSLKKKSHWILLLKKSDLNHVDLMTRFNRANPGPKVLWLSAQYRTKLWLGGPQPRL
jgi:hypothetical protein